MSGSSRIIMVVQEEEKCMPSYRHKDHIAKELFKYKHHTADVNQVYQTWKDFFQEVGLAMAGILTL